MKLPRVINYEVGMLEGNGTITMQNRYLFGKIILLYFVLTHFIMGTLYESQTLIYSIRHYGQVDFSLWLIGPILFAIALAFLMDRIAMGPMHHTSFGAGIGTTDEPTLPTMVFKLLSVFSFCFGLYAISNLDRSFRYGDYGMSEGDSFFQTMILSTIPGALNVLLFYNIFCQENLLRRHRVYGALFVISFFLNANGNASVLIGLIALMIFIFPSFSESLFFRSHRRQGVKAIFRYAAVVLSVFALIFFARIYGETIKRGSSTNDVIDELSVNDWESFITFKEWLVMRLAVYYVSTKTCFYYLSKGEDIFPYSEYWEEFLENISFRAGKLLGSRDVRKPTFSSASIVNFYWLAPTFREREGTAPGLIAGFFYYFPLPFNMLALGLYLFLFRLVVSRFAQRVHSPLSLIGNVFFLYWLFPFFESPIDALTLFDNASIIYALFLVLSFGNRSLPTPVSSNHRLAQSHYA